MFSTNIFGWYDLICHLETITKKDFSFDHLVLYSMCQIAKNTKDMWDGKGFTTKQVKKIFGRIRKLLEANNGIAENEDGKSLDLEYVFTRVFQTHNQMDKQLNYSQYLPSGGEIYKNFCDISRWQTHNQCGNCWGNSGPLQTVHLCEECRLDAFKKYFVSEKHPNDPEYYRRKYGYLFSFSDHIIAGVKCVTTSDFS
jgi:hypothetical protein